MKKIILGLLIFSASMLGQTAKAQFNVNVNIGSQPVWGPVGYDYVDYYYLPDIGVYYNVPNRQFIYLDAGRWIFSAGLPYRYRNYDLYRGYKVVVNRPYAYRYWNDDRVRYNNYRDWRGSRQVIIRDRPNYRQQSPRVVYRNQPDRRDDYRNDRRGDYRPQQRVVYNTRNVRTVNRNDDDNRRYVRYDKGGNRGKFEYKGNKGGDYKGGGNGQGRGKGRGR